MTAEREEVKVTDMTFFQLENLIGDMRFEIDTLKFNLAQAREELDKLENGDELAAERRKVRTMRSEMKAWKNVADLMYQQLKTAQEQLDRFQIGVSPNVDLVLASYRSLRDTL